MTDMAIANGQDLPDFSTSRKWLPMLTAHNEYWAKLGL